MRNPVARVKCVLRYFECRSRGQALRFALEDAGVAFEDRRVPLGEVDGFRRDAHQPGIGGPWASLPVLECDGAVIGQTLAIASFLSDLGVGAPPPEDAPSRALLAMVTSAAHLDMQVPFSRLLWLPADCPHDRLAHGASALLASLHGKLLQLEAVADAQLGDAPFFGGVGPAVADAFVYESLSRAADVLGHPFAAGIRRAPRMNRLFRTMDARPGIAAARTRLPFQVTASPSEPALRERLAQESPL